MGNDKKNSDQNKVIERERTRRKRLYEPPKLTTVSLFADQVLGTCNKQPSQSAVCDLNVFMS